MGRYVRGQPYSHKLLQLLALHAGSELALLVCVEAIISRSLVSELASEIGMHCLAGMSIVRTRTRPLCVIVF
jgi:hypothetical protein